MQIFNKTLITGAAGFIGSHVSDLLIEKNISREYILLDAGFTGSNFLWLSTYKDKSNVKILKADLSKDETYEYLDGIDSVYHIAAESHVDRSINNGIPFGLSNMLGTMKLLEFCKSQDIKFFLNKSTDEVMGQRLEEEGSFKPFDRKMPRNVYSATKSAQEELGFGYAVTHNLPVVTTRCSNIYGPRQYPEKLLPVVITKVMNGEKIPVYGEGLQEREWVFVKDVAVILYSITMNVMSDKNYAFGLNSIFHLGSMKPVKNIDFVKTVLQLMGKTDYENHITYVEDRKGHDMRYDMDCSTTHSIGLEPVTRLGEGLLATIEWYQAYFNDNLKKSWGNYE